MDFSENLLVWYQSKHRDLPWKKDRDPYKIWVSEIMLQQTRVHQAMDYFEKFVDRFPTLQSLAAASEDEVLLLWQGLGYYSRARHLHLAARHIVDRFDGVFPSDYKTLQTLPGIGSYTAAAIASFAFGIKVPAIDGNALRVLSRFFGIDLDIYKTSNKKYFFDMASVLMQPCDAAQFNQAMMDFGSLVCTPNPHCAECPLGGSCYATAHGCAARLPVNSARIPIKNRYLYYLNVHSGSRVYLKQRRGKDIWKGLYEFPLIEVEQAVSPLAIVDHPLFRQWFPENSYAIKKVSPRYIHKLSHRNLFVYFIDIESLKPLALADAGYSPVPEGEIGNYPVSRLTERYLDGDRA